MKKYLNLRDMAVTQASVAALLFIAVPFANLWGVTSYPWTATLHGLAAVMTFISCTLTLHLLYPMLRGNKQIVPQLKLYVWLSNALILLAVITGNWIYMKYRLPDGAQEWLIFHQPPVHTIGMEFKEFISLFPLPLGVAAGWLLYRFQKELYEIEGLTSIIAFLLTCSWICLGIALVFGIGLAKIRLV